MKLRTKFGLVLLAVMLVLSGVVLGSVELFKGQTVEGERADLSDTANQTAEQVRLNVDEKKEVTSSYAIRSNVGEFTDVSAELRSFLNQTDFTMAQAVAANGTVVGIWSDGMTVAEQRDRIGLDVSDQEYFTEASDGYRHVELLGPSQIRGTDRRLVLFSVPIGISESGAADGVLVAGLYVSPTERNARSTIDQSAALFRPVYPQELDTQTVRIVGRNASGEEVVLREPTRAFDESFTENATVSLGSAEPWTLTLVRDRSALDERIRWLQSVQLVGLLFVLGAVLGMGYWEYSTNLTQTRKLLAGFSALKTGNFDHRLSLRSADEWAQISDGFNEMATGLREREDAIRERERRLGVLNRVLRHNLQNDMNVILSHAEMLPSLGEDQQADAVDTIVETGTGLVEHGRKARQIEEAMEAAEDGAVERDLSEVVEHVLADLREEYPEARIENDAREPLRVSAIESLPYAVESLCENALEHNDAAAPLLRVGVDRRGDEVVLRVEDDGPGIPEYEREVVAEAAETDLEHGSGLGLFLATWVAEKSGGGIEFEVPDDGGTVVELSLPAAGPAAEASGDGKAQPAAE